MARLLAAVVIFLFAAPAVPDACAQSSLARQSARSVQAGGSAVSASHSVRIRIRPHSQFVVAGTRVLRDSDSRRNVEYDAVRLHTNLAGIRVSTSVDAQGRLSMLQSRLDDQPRYANGRPGIADVFVPETLTGSLFLLDRHQHGHQRVRYITVTE